jgi:hypothetical protein
MTYQTESLWMPPKRTQTEIVLEALRTQTAGVCGVWFLDRNMPRYPARIYDLSRKGYRIERVSCPYPYHKHAKSIATYRLEAGL